MHWNSFRLRTALLSASLAGTALLGFALIFGWLLRTAEIGRLDARLNNQVVQTFPLIHPPDLGRTEFPESMPLSSITAPKPTLPGITVWRSLETTLPEQLGIDTNVPVALLITDSNGQVIYQSKTWLSSFDPNRVWNEESNSFLDLEAELPKLINSAKESTNTDMLLSRVLQFSPNQLVVVEQHTPSGNWRMSGVKTDRVNVAIAVSLQAIDQEMAEIRTLFLITIPMVLVLIAAGAWLLSGSALRPIQRLTHSMQQVTVQGLNQRVPTVHTDIEFVELIQVFNQMLERLERSFHQALRFSGDAAHELRTPLAILQGELEQTIQRLDDGSPMQQTLSNLLDEVRRLSGIVRKLLLLSLADAGQMQLHYVELDLAVILQELVEDITLLAPELHVHTEIDPYLKLRGDRDLLTQVLQNLISNAVKYNQTNGWIHILALAQESTIQVTIRNASENIPVEDRDRIFDRFHRGDVAHTRKVEGVGLGLSLAREIVRTHRGTLTLDPTLSGETAFTLTLPQA